MPRTASVWAQDLATKSMHVDTSISSGKDFTSSASIVLAAKKGTMTDGTFQKNSGETADDFEVIGVVQNASVSQNKQLAQIFEIGSKESYFVPGRTVVQASISRVSIDGDSLMKVMYPNGTRTSDAGFSDPAGHTYYINLASDFFNNSLDLAFFFYDGQADPVGAFYLKDAHIQAHQISLASQQTVVLENISLRASQVIGLDSVAPDGKEPPDPPQSGNEGG